MVADEAGKSKVFDMPKESYMMHKKKGEQEGCFLLVSPWKFAGMGAKSETEEYWVLGAQFLQNYYSMYDFKEHKIGLVESVTSRMINQKGAATKTKEASSSTSGQASGSTTTGEQASGELISESEGDSSSLAQKH